MYKYGVNFRYTNTALFHYTSDFDIFPFYSISLSMTACVISVILLFRSVPLIAANIHTELYQAHFYISCRLLVVRP